MCNMQLGGSRHWGGVPGFGPLRWTLRQCNMQLSGASEIMGGGGALLGSLLYGDPTSLGIYLWGSPNFLRVSTRFSRLQPRMPRFSRRRALLGGPWVLRSGVISRETVYLGYLWLEPYLGCLETPLISTLTPYGGLRSSGAPIKTPQNRRIRSSVKPAAAESACRKS